MLFFKYLKKIQTVYRSKNVLPYLNPWCNHISWINTGINDSYSAAEQKKDEWARISDERKELQPNSNAEG